MRAEPWDLRLRYHAWLLRQRPTGDDLARERMAVRRWVDPPRLSVLTPVYNTPPELLRRMVRSVQQQTYPHWELCLVDDGSPLHWTADYLARLAAGDPRIRLLRRPRNGGIVAASNDALALATGLFIVPVDDDDELDPRALYAMAEQIRARPDVDVVYADFDVIGSDGVPRSPVLQPGWSPELLLAVPYLVHPIAYRRALVERVGGFRPEYEGSQDYDLALRVSRQTDRIVHVPKLLYHWRQWSRSVAANPDAKPYAYAAGVRAIEDHLRHQPFEGIRRPGHAIGYHIVRFAIRGEPVVSLIVSARPLETLRPSLIALARGTGYAHRECLVVGPRDRQQPLLDSLDAAVIEALRLRYVAVEAGTDPALAANLAAAQAIGTHLLFLGADLEPLDEDWLAAMLEFSQQPGIGAVGAKIYERHGPPWHAGIVVPRARPHLVQADDLITRNYSAVSGACLMTPRGLFDAVGGFEPASRVGCSDVDYCLRLRSRGARCVLTPQARLRHIAAPPAEPTALQREIFHDRWGPQLPFDPFYNRNFRQDGAFFVPALD